MADVFGKMAVKLTGGKGKKIFRYNTWKHNLELADGQPLDALIEETENKNEVSSDRDFFYLDDMSLAGAEFSADEVHDLDFMLYDIDYPICKCIKINGWNETV